MLTQTAAHADAPPVRQLTLQGGVNGAQALSRTKRVAVPTEIAFDDASDVVQQKDLHDLNRKQGLPQVDLRQAQEEVYDRIGPRPFAKRP